jgi:hypothetical protein
MLGVLHLCCNSEFFWRPNKGFGAHLVSVRISMLKLKVFNVSMERSQLHKFETFYQWEVPSTGLGI